MSIYSIVEEIAERESGKPPFGDNLVHGVLVGIVTDHKNGDHKGMIQVQIPLRDTEDNILKMVKVSMPMCGKDWGYYFIPEIGDQVLLAFENGSIERPYMIGAIPRKNANFINQAYKDGNELKRIRTKGGNTVTFDDTKDKEAIELITPKQQSVRIDDEKQTITLKNKDSSDKVVLDSGKDTAVVAVKSKITLKAGSTTIEINGENDTVTINCKQLVIKAQQGIKEKTGTYSLKSNAFDIKASGMATIKSDSLVTIKGQTVSLG